MGDVFEGNFDFLTYFLDFLDLPPCDTLLGLYLSTGFISLPDLIRDGVIVCSTLLTTESIFAGVEAELLISYDSENNQA